MGVLSSLEKVRLIIAMLRTMLAQVARFRRCAVKYDPGEGTGSV